VVDPAVTVAIELGDRRGRVLDLFGAQLAVGVGVERRPQRIGRRRPCARFGWTALGRLGGRGRRQRESHGGREQGIEPGGAFHGANLR